MDIFGPIGAAAAVTAAVDDLCRRLIADRELTPYVDGLDMSRLKSRQRSFIAAAIGGPDPWLGGHIPRKYFDRIVTHLVDTLTDLGVSTSILDQIDVRITRLRDEVAPPITAVRAG